MKLCAFDPCERPAEYLKYCAGHRRQTARGIPLRPLRPVTTDSNRTKKFQQIVRLWDTGRWSVASISVHTQVSVPLVRAALTRAGRDVARRRSIRVCRCDVCVAYRAMTSRQRQDRAARLEAGVPARRQIRAWTGAEIGQAVRPDMSAHEAAVMLGRSEASVESIRYAIRSKTHPRHARYMQLWDEYRRESGEL